MISRRTLIASSLGVSFAGSRLAAQGSAPAWRYPIGWEGQPPLAGFVNRHGFQVENTRFIEGWWHTGENYYARNDAETSGAIVYAVSDGEVIYADFDYPGRVILIDHGDALISQYGHLDFDLFVQPGDRVAAGDPIATVLRQVGERSPSHLHFEVRNFVTRDDVNGSSPRYGVNCGFECPPGPGYWPMQADELPAELGWYNPTHVIASRMATPFAAFAEESTTLFIHDVPDGDLVDEIDLASGEEVEVLEVFTGAIDSPATGAEATIVWYRLESGWLRAWEPFDEAVQNDGRPASLRPLLIPGAA
jgi:murein DD-endopeptidase MepM/ murein hydrolase activator NlpD